MADDRKPSPEDESETVPVPRVEPNENTPPPLPPSPASAKAEQWFEDAPTRPSALTDIASSLPSRSGTLSEPGHLRAPAQPARHQPSVGLLALVAVTFLAVGIVVGALLMRAW